MGRADLHMHSTVSDGALSPEDLMSAIEGMNIKHRKRYGNNFLDVVGVSDHNNIEGSYIAQEFALRNGYGFEVVICEEVTSLDGHILGVDIKVNVPKLMSAKDTIEHIHYQQGLAFAAHPYTIANIAGRTGFKGVAGKIKTENFDAVETINSNPTEFFNNVWASIINNGKLPQVGNSDAHFPMALGRAYTTFPGTTFQEYKQALLRKETKARGHIWGIFELNHYLNDRKIMKEYYAREQAERK